MDYRAMYEGKYLGAWNLVDANGHKRDVTVTIAKVEAGNIVGEGGKTAKKPLLRFEGKELPMVCAKTNGKIIAALYGPEVRGWEGKRITLYATTTSVGGEEKDCIRVRPTVPPEPKRNNTSERRGSDDADSPENP